MKKIQLILAAAAFSLLLLSCGNKEEKNSVTNQQTEAANAHHHDDEPASGLALNDGKKWVVNEEMTPYLLKGSASVKDYIHNKQTDYKTLASQLKDQNDQLIKSCTMDGESHDELHKWLVPHIELVEKLAKASDTNEAAVLVQQIEKSYQEFENYFQ